MARGRIATKTQSKLGMILFGVEGTGKSTLASQFAYFKRPDGKPFRVLYIDNENGSIDDFLPKMEEDGVDLSNIYILYTQSITEVRDYIRKVKNNEDFYILDEDGNETEEILLDSDGSPFRADAIVIDGTTILNVSVKQSLIEFSKKRNAVKAKKDGLIGDEKVVKIEGAGLELKDYNTINFKGQDLILDLMSCGVHYIITARETDEKISVKDADGKITSVSTGKKVPEGFKELAYNVKTVVRMYTDEDGNFVSYVSKDRTGVHDKQTVEDLSLFDWQSVIDKTANNQQYVIKNDLTKAVETEHKNITKEMMNIAGDEDSEENTSECSIDDIKAKIADIQKSLSPMEKPQAKAILTEKGLPLAIKSVTDINILKAIFDALDEFAQKR